MLMTHNTSVAMEQTQMHVGWSWGCHMAWLAALIVNEQNGQALGNHVCMLY